MNRHNEPEFHSFTFIDAAETGDVLALEAVTKRDKIADILYSPTFDAFVVVTESELEAITQACTPYQQSLSSLETAKKNLAASPNSKDAQQKHDQAQKEISDKLKALATGGVGSDNRWLELHRVHKANDVIYAPGRILNPKDPSKNRTFYFLTEEPADSENAFKSVRAEDGTIDGNKLKEAFRSQTSNIKAEWKLPDRSGQVRSRAFVDAFSPALASLLNDELTVLDNWIANVNKALKWQSEQYQSEKEEILELLKHSNDSPLTFENYGKAQLLCREIWKDNSPLINIDYVDINPNQGENTLRHETIIKRIENIQLPPSVWQGSAEANLMRWKASANAGFQFDLKEGKLAAEANAEFDFALAEGKLAGSLFYPHDEGIAAKVSVKTKSKHQKFQPFIGAFDDSDRVNFDVDSEFLSIQDVQNLSAAFAHWNLLKKTVNDNYKLTVIGHTSLTGSDDYNMRLSARRAAMVYGFLTRDVDLWKSMFDRGYWGERERQKMKDVLTQYHYGSGSTFQEKPLTPIYFGGDAELIRKYFVICETYFGYGIGSIPELVPAEFATDYLVAKGELDPIINTTKEEKLNRRVEFVLLEAGEVTEKDQEITADFGYFRLQFQGHVSAWAGLNANISGKVEVDCSGGQMLFADWIGADASAGAFAGAKAEAGLAAALDWCKPSPQSERVNPSDFGAIGTVGYIVQGQAGIGGNASFTIGYDDDIQRFVIKVKASLCVGLGGGGKFEFSIDAKQVWNFIKLVYEQLYNADFNFVDVFEAEVYERFCLWSEELIKQGLWFQGLALRSGIESANLAVQISEKIMQLGERTIESQQESNDLYEVIEQIKREPDQLVYAPPEVKGRILYRLIYQKSNIWNDFSFSGWHEDREDAVKIVLEKGVKTRREYREVLEHMLPQSVSGRSEEEKYRHAAKAQTRLVMYMRDDEDRQSLMNWWETLPDPSNCSCGVGRQRVNPFY